MVCNHQTLPYTESSRLYYKPITIVNDDSSAISKLETSLTDDARVIIYDCHMFIVQATSVNAVKLFSFNADDKAKYASVCT